MTGIDAILLVNYFNGLPTLSSESCCPHVPYRIKVQSVVVDKKSLDLDTIFALVGWRRLLSTDMLEVSGYNIAFVFLCPLHSNQLFIAQVAYEHEATARVKTLASLAMENKENLDGCNRRTVCYSDGLSAKGKKRAGIMVLHANGKGDEQHEVSKYL